LAKGISGVQYGARPVLHTANLEAIEAAAVDWFKELADAVGPALEDHPRRRTTPKATFQIRPMNGREVQ
jgi:hypothetical protein